jgi:hypothetical protein
MSVDPNKEFVGPYRGTSPGDGGSFAAAAHDAEQDILKRHGRLPHPPITFKADCYVTIGNPIHEFIVELSTTP